MPQSHDNEFEPTEVDVDPWAGTAIALFCAEQYEEAMESFEETLELESIEPQTLYWRAQDQLELGNHDRSLKLFALALKKGHPDVSGIIETIESISKHLVETNENSEQIAKSYFDIGIEFLENDNFNDAIEYFATALGYGDDEPSSVYFYMSCACYCAPLTEEILIRATSFAEAAIKHGYERPGNLYYTIGIHYEPYNVEQAIAMLKKALYYGHEEEEEEICFTLASYHMQLNDTDEAIQICLEAIEKFGGYKGYIELARIHEENGNNEEAAACYKEAVDNGYPEEDEEEVPEEADDVHYTSAELAGEATSMEVES